MKTLIYSAKPFEKPFLEASAHNTEHEFVYTSERLTLETAEKSKGFDAISIFSADDASENILAMLKSNGVKYITLRSAGYDNVNLTTATKYGLKVANVPEYSPNAIAEHAIALLMSLKRHIITANKQVKKNNFALGNLVGSNVENKTIGVLGSGRIGSIIIKILHGFDCEILVNDREESEELIQKYDVKYTSIKTICEQANIIIISLPLTRETKYLINEDFFNNIKKDDLILVNIARGGIVKTTAILDALASGKLKGYATDVYEKESGVFFYHHNSEEIEDPLLKELIYNPKVLLTPHQAFATEEAITNICETTVENLTAWKKNKRPKNQLN